MVRVFKNYVAHIFRSRNIIHQRLLILSVFILMAGGMLAHGVQVAYCITNNGTIRIYIEHWHGNVTAAQTANAQVQIIVDDGMTVNNQFYPAQGVVWDTAIDDLPDCKESIVSISGCTTASAGRIMNTQNDWSYWEFTAPSCGGALTLTVASVTGSQSFYFDEGCGNLYPASFTATFEDCAPPVLDCTANDLTVDVDAGLCSADITTGLDPIILFDDCTSNDDLIITHDVSGASIFSGSGPANGTYNKGVSTVTYTVEDETGKQSTCDFDVTVEDNNGPTLTCPSMLTLECGDTSNDVLIENWIASFSATDGCGIMSTSNNYDPTAFATITEEDDTNPFIGPRRNPINIGMASLSLFDQSGLIELASECKYQSEMSISEMSGQNQYDVAVQAIIRHKEGMSENYSDLLITDIDSRVVPYWIESFNDESAIIWMKIPELKADKKSIFKVSYGECIGNDYGPDDVFKGVYKEAYIDVDILDDQVRVLTKLLISDQKNKIIINDSESSYQFSLGARPSGNVSMELARLEESKIPWPLYLEGNKSYGEAFYFDFFRNNKDVTTQNIIRNNHGITVVSDRFIDDGFTNINSIDIEYPENIEFIAVFPTPSVLPVVEGDLFLDIMDIELRENEIFQSKTDNSTAYINKSMMGCDCVASQGTQSFNINAIQNTEDDVAFYSYSNPNGASANTGLEMNDAVVLFLYENTLTGEISLFILIDAAGGGNGGRGSVDFFCLSSSATLDFSDDPGEISGIFPTVTADWRWANCCTDGALIGNVGCNSTFDFYPNFTSGINQIKWASGTLANPTYTVFNSISEPVRISCGGAQPACCPNTNSVALTNATCPSSMDGAIDVTTDPSGAPYSFVWSNGATTEDISGLDVGTYTATVTDVNNCTQIIANDITAEEVPTLTCPSNVTVAMTGSSATIALSDLNYTVNYACPDDISETCNGCGTFDCGDQNSTELVTVQVEDVLGNTDECVVSVFIENMPPNVQCPSDLTLECADANNDGFIEDWLTTVSASDDEGVVVSLNNNYNPTSFSFENEDQEESSYRRTVSGKQNVEGPKDYYYVLKSIERTLAKQKKSMAAMPGPIKGSQVVTFVATDECGNTSSCTATIVINDTTAPTVTCPDDITVECGDPNNNAIITTWLGTAVYFDDCNGDGIISNNYGANPTGGCSSNTGDEVVTFTADDGCGNTSTCTATVSIEDNLPPEFLMKPRDITLECDSEVTSKINNWIALNGFGMAEDDCAAILMWTTVAGAQTSLCGATFTQEYTFSVTDECGNAATSTAMVTVEDTEAPIITPPMDITVDCVDGDIPSGDLSAWLMGVTTSEDCSGENVTNQLFNFVADCGSTGVYTYQFTVTDDCNNSSQAFATVTTQDNDAPTPACPSALILECGDPSISTDIQAWLSSVTGVGTDDCDDAIVNNDFSGSLPDGCGASTTVTFTFTDPCGNNADCMVDITINDTQAPVFVNCSSDLTVNVDAAACDANVIFSTPVAFDECKNPVTVMQTAGPNSGSTFPLGVSTIAFEAMDDCGLLSDTDCTFDITVVDSGTPSIDCPSNITRCADAGACDWMSDETIDPLANENCTARIITYDITGATTSSGNDSASGEIFELGTSTLCYTISDGAGSSSSCCFDILIEDCENPVVTCPTDMTVECDGAGNTAEVNAWLPGASAVDNCDTNPVITNLPFNTISGCGATETIIYEFTATDAAGNVDACLASFIIEDTTVPNIDVAAIDDLVECNPASNQADLFAWLNTFASATSSDDCGDITWSHDFSMLSDDCGDTGMTTVVFTATDECGNTATSSADFIIEDTSDPEITCPDNISLQCNGDDSDAVITNWLSSAAATDGCGNAMISNDYPGVSSASCGTTGFSTVTFTATDDCGNTATCSAIITIDDTTIPDFLLRPQDMIVECDGAGNAADVASWLASNGGGIASDRCDNSVTWNNTLSNSTTVCGGSTETIYLFTVTDDCGNAATALATFVIEDTSLPTITVPADMTVECDGVGNVTDLTDWLEQVTASDLCSATVATSNQLYNTISACGGGYSETYIFTGVDECGNDISELATFTVEDTSNPMIVCPDNLDLSCGADSNPTLINAWLLTAIPTDDASCSEVTYTNDYDGTLPANCGGSLTVTFTAEDECGNVSTCTADITMNDVASPDFIGCPEDLTINVDVGNCGSNPIFSTPQVIDNCGVTAAQTAGPASGTTFPVGTSSIEFTATDECGNTEVCAFDITVIDSSTPDIDCLDNVEACVDNACMWTSTDIGPITGNDNCTEYTITYNITGVTTASGMDDASGTLFNLGTSVLCYTITDASNNTAVCCFDILVSDCEAPEITCPMDMAVECDGAGNPSDLMAWLGTVSAIDNCNDNATLSNSEINNISDCGGSETIVYEFSAEDEALNAAFCIASFTIEDTTVPDVDIMAADLTEECNGFNNTTALVAWLNGIGGASGSDVCSGVSWTHDFDSPLTPVCGASGNRTVIFTVTDDCGNSATSSADFIIEDTTAPDLSCPQSIILECGDSANDAIISTWLATAESTDDCGDVIVSNDYPDEYMPVCGDAGIFTVTFTSTDDCNNTKTCVRSVTIEDTSAPFITLRSTDLELECADPNNSSDLSAWLALSGGATAEDDCDANLTWTNTPLATISNCGGTEETPYVFTATDACGNFSTTVSVYRTIDTTPPTIMAPADITVECDGNGNIADQNAWLATVTSTDDCGLTTNEYVLFSTIAICGNNNNNVFQFIATDECGNQSTSLASFTIEDTSSPIINCPADLNLECGNSDNDQIILAWLNDATSSDLSTCSDVTITHDYPGSQPDPLTCNGGVGTVITFVATDDCGNSESCQATITMDDTIDPYFINCHDDVTLPADVNSCERSVLYSTPVAFDQCDDMVDVTLTAGLASGSMFPVGTTTVTYLATDDCGNTFECTFDITIVDGETPELDCPSNDVVKCTDTDVCTWMADDDVDTTTEDQCGIENLYYTITGATNISSPTTGVNNISDVPEIFNIGTSTVTYTIEDEAGNMSTCEFDVIIEDCQDPLITCNDQLDVACGTDDVAAWMTSIEATATDNCDAMADLTISNVLNTDISSCGNNFDRVYEFTVTDLSGNSSSCLARYSTVDNVPPVITDAITESYECDGTDRSDDLTAWLNNNGGATFSSDNCSTDVEWSNNFIGGLVPTCGNTGAVTVVFIATDDCGNTSTTTGTFEVTDNTEPVLTCPENLSLECGGPDNTNTITNWLALATADDACSGTLEVTNNYSDVFADGCGASGTYTVTFTATDDCSNSSTCSRQIIIADTVDPEIEIGASDLILECADAGNTAAIADWEMNNGTAVATDECSDEALTWTIVSQDEVTECGASSSTLYTFQVEDNCGNTNTTQASIIIKDNTDPILTLPEVTTIECGTETATSLSDFIAEATATDDCGVANVDAVIWNTISACGNTNTTVYLFTATDACGNQSTGFSEYIIEDTQEPVITCPTAELSLECGNPNNQSLIASWINSAVATDPDMCNSVTVSNDYPGGLPFPLECNGGAGILVTFTATDDCDNTSNCMSTITMNDTVDPFFVNCPSDIIVSIDSDACDSRVIYPTPNAADACADNPIITFIDGIESGEVFPLGITTITFEVADACGNTARCEFDITVEDKDEPAIECPVNDVEVCADIGDCSWLSDDSTDPIIADNCMGLTLTYDIDFSDGSATSGAGTVSSNNIIFPLGTSTINYTLIDDAGNDNSCAFEVTVRDCENPTITCMDVADVMCGEQDIFNWSNDIAATMMDNCDALSDLSFTSEIQTDFSSCGNTIDQIYLFTVTDQAGNQDACTARYSTVDLIAPVITDAIDETIECSMDENSDNLLAWLNNNGGATFVSDNCGSEVSWTNDFTTSLSDGCALTGTVTVVFTATDDCGNTSTTSADFTVEDTTEPVITCPTDIFLECGADENSNVIITWLDRAEATDNCDANLNITHDFGSVFSAGCGLAGIHDVTFTVSDACGNSTSCHSTISLDDTTNPTIDTAPSDLELECAGANNAAEISNWEMNFGGAIALDNCSDDPLVWEIVSQLAIGTCGDNTSTEYIFSVTDNCGNSTTTSASVIITDTTDPELTIPNSLTEECENITLTKADWIDSATATDDCGTVTIAAQLWNTISGCGNTETEQYLFTATDACGNQSTGFSEYTIEDTTGPIITCPSDLVLECGDPNNAILINNWLQAAIISDEYDCNNVGLSNDYNGGLPSPLTCNSGSGMIITFLATDDCGNSSSCTASISMNDTVAPEFTNCPSDMTVNVDVDLCSNNVIYSTPVAIDNCQNDPDVNFVSGITSGQTFPLGTTTITFEAEDNCDNTSLCVFDITVEDSDTPSIQCPSNDVVVCNDVTMCTWESNSEVDPVIADNCTGFILTYEVVGNTSATSSTAGINTLDGDGIIFELGNSIVTYIIEDGAGNMSSCSFDVIVNDCESPELTCSDITSDCSAEDVMAWTSAIGATATDNCNTNAELVTISQLITDISSCGSTINQVYLFTVEDQAGNTSDCSATITTTDTTNPNITTPAADVVLECSDVNYAGILIAWLSNNGGAEATDECSSPLVWTNDFGGNLNESCGLVGETNVVFTVTDDCGNSSTTSAMFIIEDNTAATINCPADIVVECGEPNNNIIISTWLNGSLAQDNCGGVSATNDYMNLPECGQTVDVTFTVTGNCDGEVVQCVATITTEDTQKPVIMTPPQDLFLECDGAGNDAEILMWIADNTANDPSLGMSAQDNCAGVSIMSAEVMRTDGCGESTIISYLYSVTDDCGNSISEVAKVHITDTEPPVLNLPTAESVVECDTDVAFSLSAWITSATTSDICGGSTVTYTLLGQSDLCEGVISKTEFLYQFTARDNCGNETVGIDVFTIEDNVAPVITAPANLELSCGDDVGSAIVAWLMDYEVTEACQTYTVTNDFDGVVPSACGGSETITWTVTDECGASSTASAMVIESEDVAPPTIDFCPADITLVTEFGQCDAVLNHSTPTASDCNHPVTIVKTGGPAIGTMINAGETVTIEFTATDNCGNTSICAFDVTVLDQQLPTISCPSNDVIKCNDELTCSWLSDDDVSPINFSDNCNDVVVTYDLSGATISAGSDDAAGEIFNSGTTTVVYTISDENGNNAVTCTFDVQVNDCEDPVFTCSDALNVNCGEDDLDAWMDGIENSITDNCTGDVDFDVLILADVSSCGNTFERSYLFTVTDLAGNTSTCNATYSTTDNVPPTIDQEAQDLIIECDGSSQSIFLISWLNSNGGATASDACSQNITWTNDFTGNVTRICGSASEINVTFTATDDCGNSSETSAVFRIEDTTDPLLSVPDNLILDCNNNLNSFLISIWLNGATASDNCQATVNVTSDFPGVITANCGMTATHLITFTATDNCNNSTTATSQIVIQDNEEPTIVRPATDLVLECADNFESDIDTWVMGQGGAMATDNCSDESLVWTSEIIQTNLTCGTAGETTYMFTVADNCGNTSTTTASVVITDTTPPELTIPTDAVEECGAVVTTVEQWLDLASATDACGEATVEHLFWNRQDGCGSTYSERYLFTATDDCGNSSTSFAEYRIVDTQSPMITCPQDLILECGDPDNSIALLAWLESVTGTDVNDCSEVFFDYTAPASLPAMDCSGQTFTTVEFLATDACGNTNTCTADIYMNDTQAPVFVNCPVDITVNVDVDLCGANPLFSTPVADDACSVDVTQTMGPVSGSTFDVGDSTIGFVAEDACGNTAECTFTITVIDSDVPMILCPSNMVIVDTDPGVCTWTSDDKVNPSISFENCPDQIIEYTITGATTSSGNDSAMGEVFALGDSEVCYTITDASGNTSSCCFNVQVEDNELPEIICPNDTLVVATTEVNGVCVANYEWTHPSPTDNCGIDYMNLNIEFPDGTDVDIDNVTPDSVQNYDFPAGYNTLVYTVYDVNGNSATCDFEVEILGIKHEKTIARVTQNLDDSYCIEYNVRVYNTGDNVGFYSLTDSPMFDDDFVMLSAEYTSSVHLTTPLALINPTGSWTLASQVPLIGYDSHIYTITTCVIMDLKDPNTPGDGLYTLCDDDSDGNLEAGEGLYNETFLDANSDGTVDQRDTVCADIPYVTHEKDFVGYTYDPLTCSYNAQFKITVQNIGGEPGNYDLWDQPFFEDDVVINSVRYTTDAIGHITNGTPQVLAGTGPWDLAEDQAINNGVIQCFYLDFNVSLNLSDPSTAGDEIYTWCNSSLGNLPQAGEGLYNESYLDRSNDGSPEEIEEACGDIEIVDLALTKKLVSQGPYAYGDIIEFSIEVFNQGNIPLQNIRINDYVPIGYSYTGVTNDPNWSEVSPGNLLYNNISFPIAPQDSRMISLYLRLEQTSGGYTHWDNYAEIGYVEDTNGEDRTLDDVDSTADNIDGNDNAVVPRGPNDDVIAGAGPLKDQDEDDHDPAGPRIFDLAIRKTFDSANSVYAYGGNTRFIIEVFNQGNQDAKDVTITDYLPCGLTFNPNSNVNVANGWVHDLATNQVVTVLPNILVPGSSVMIEIDLNLEACYTTDAWLNEAEISSADDTDPLTVGLPDDLDSDLDSTNGNDSGGNSDVTGEDDEINDDGTTDEDDHDIQELGIFDLALKKVIANSGPYAIGDIATFEIIVYNQGSVPATDIVLTDYLNSGFAFDPNDNIGWTQTGNIVQTSINTILQPTDSIIVPLSLEVVIDNDPSFEDWFNYAEIESALDTLGNATDDIDSDPGSNADYETDVVPCSDDDNNVFGHGPNCPTCPIQPQDEDDHDPEKIFVIAQIGDFVWKDINGNGRQDQGEPGVPGVTVNLLSCDGSVIATEVTDGNGFYLFDQVIPGDYIVEFDISELLAGCDFTYPNLGLDDIDSDADENGRTECITIIAGEYNHTIDAGLIPLASIGNYVWQDWNGDGIQDPNEPGLEGVVVSLYDEDGSLVGTLNTDADGYYCFTNLYPGNYYLEFGSFGNLGITTANAGSNDNIDSDVDGSNGPNTTAVTTLGPGENDKSWDAGYYSCVSIGELVWFDYNENDMIDPSENGINGMKVELYRQVGAIWELHDVQYTGHKPGTPSDDGYFKFCTQPGTYYLKFLNPPQTLVPVVPNVGINELLDSDVTRAFGPGTTDAFTLSSGGEKCDIAAGYYTMATLGDNVWSDDNSNGLRDYDEVGVPGVIVRAYDIEGTMLGEAETDFNGEYIIDYLGKNSYYLEFDLPNGLAVTEPNMGNDETIDSDVDGSNGPMTTDLYTVNPGEHIPNIDAGVVLGVLSVEWLDVSVENNGTHHSVLWQLASETNVSHYEIERSIDGIDNFETIGKVLSRGDSESEATYLYEDYDVQKSGTYYYRIREVDQDGKNNLSKIVAVERDDVIIMSHKNSADIYPNPVVDELTLQIDIAATVDDLNVDIYDAQGRLAKANAIIDVDIEAGQKSYKLNVRDFAKGVYSMKINLDRDQIVKKLIIVE